MIRPTVRATLWARAGSPIRLSSFAWKNTRSAKRKPTKSVISTAAESRLEARLASAEEYTCEFDLLDRGEHRGLDIGAHQPKTRSPWAGPA